MKKIKAHCGIGFAGATYEEEFEFEDDVTDYEINDEIYDWGGTIPGNLVGRKRGRIDGRSRIFKRKK